MFVFKRAPRQTLSDLESFLREVGDEAVEWLAREVKSWGEFSYAELEELILSGHAADLIDWQNRYAKVVNEKFNPLWLAAIARASYNSTRGKITIDDSDPRVKEFLRTRAADLIRDLSDESRRAIANVILHGQAEHLAPREIARQIRPLIGLNARQAQANVNYRQRVFNRLIDNGLSIDAANKRADRSAVKYASKQHRFRAETIVHTELARAYNQGAHDGILAAQRAGLMNHCEMIWTTAGTNRVCGRCLSLKDTVVGRTNEVGVQLPPLHPRCRCTISYREMTDKPTSPFQRPARNQGAFSHLEVSLQLRAVKQLCRKYGVDISDLKIKIQREEDWLRSFYMGAADPKDIGRVDLFPNTFVNEEQLLRTVIHEGCHVKQFKKYGSVYVQEHRKTMEDVAERYEDFFFRIVKRRRVS